MDNLLPIGTLVRVRDIALAEGQQYSEPNRRFVESHGYLHVVLSNDDDLQMFKSLASGYEHSFFFDDEVEEQPDD